MMHIGDYGMPEDEEEAFEDDTGDGDDGNDGNEVAPGA